MPTLSPDAIISSGVARRLLSQRGHSAYTGEVTETFISQVVSMPYPESCRDQHAWNAESRALAGWLTVQQAAGQPIDFEGVSLDFDVVPWCYGRSL